MKNQGKKKRPSGAGSPESLDQKLKEAEEKLAKLRIDLKAGKLKKTSVLKAVQRELARIKTNIRRKELSL